MAAKKKSKRRLMVQCGDHKWAPAAIVCVHLVKGKSKEFHTLEGEGCEYDRVCTECLKKLPDISPDDLMCLCMHCIRQIEESATKGKR